MALCKVRERRARGFTRNDGVRSRPVQGALKLAGLRHLNCYLPVDATAYALTEKIVACRGVTHFGNIVLDGEVELQFSRKTRVRVRRQIGRTRFVRGNKLGTGLSQLAKLLAVSLKLEVSKERNDAVLEHGVIHAVK